MSDRLNGRVDVKLTPEGMSEVVALGSRLEGLARLHVYSSPQLRARQTAQAIAARHGVEPGIEPGLDEVDFGDWTGKRFAELATDPDWHVWNSRRATARAPGGETMWEVQRRMLATMRRIARRHHGGRVALVSHAEVIRAALLHLTGRTLNQYSEVAIDPAGVSTVVATRSAMRVVAVNERAARVPA